MMKDLLIRLSENANGVAGLLSSLDRNALSRGQLILSPRFLSQLLDILTGDDLKIRDVSMGDDGTIHLTAAVGSNMELGYKLKIERFSAANGRADGQIAFSEERKGGGLGGALLGMTGNSGLAFALSKHKWIKVSDKTISIQSSALPVSLRASFVSAGRGGLIFRIS